MRINPSVCSNNSFVSFLKGLFLQTQPSFLIPSCPLLPRIAGKNNEECNLLVIVAVTVMAGGSKSHLTVKSQILRSDC